jgi:hypothetical protein
MILYELEPLSGSVCPIAPQNVWVDSHFEGIQGHKILYAIVVPRISATVELGWSR